MNKTLFKRGCYDYVGSLRECFNLLAIYTLTLDCVKIQLCRVKTRPSQLTSNPLVVSNVEGQHFRIARPQVDPPHLHVLLGDSFLQLGTGTVWSCQSLTNCCFYAILQLANWVCGLPKSCQIHSSFPMSKANTFVLPVLRLFLRSCTFPWGLASPD